MKLRNLFRLNPFNPNFTVNQARDAWVGQIMNKGGKCPVCDRYGKVYKYNVNFPVVSLCLWLYQEGKRSKNGWVNYVTDAPKEIKISNAQTKAAYLGLVERPTDEHLVKYWRITTIGKLFLHGMPIPEYVFTYGTTVVEIEGEEIPLITIREAIKNKGFDYDEVMKPIKL